MRLANLGLANTEAEGGLGLTQNSGLSTASAATDILTQTEGIAVENDQEVVFFAVPSGSLPGGITAGTTYWVVNASGGGFQISPTRGGGPVNITSDGTAGFTPGGAGLTRYPSPAGDSRWGPVI